MTELRRWADEQQYIAQPMEANRDARGNIVPRVTLLWMTPDPLGALACFARIYKEGKPTYHMSEISDEERIKAWDDVQRTHLKAPLEAIKMHFFIEGVTRSFTHQMVRQRTAVYAQESLRFAVKENFMDEVSNPPSIAAMKEDDPRMVVWREALQNLNVAYEQLVNNGVPAEDARGLLPHAVTTRLHFVTDLRNLADHMGNRLCTQAQFEWRTVALGIVKALREYTPDFSWLDTDVLGVATAEWETNYRWQFQTISSSNLFRPVCYQVGHCPFQASFDRACTIRDRVERGAFREIDNAEWLMDPAAARLVSRGGDL